MVKIFSWSIVLCILLYIIGTLILPFVAIGIMPYYIGFVVVLGIVSSIGLIISLVSERIKDRKDEEDDLNKY